MRRHSCQTAVGTSFDDIDGRERGVGVGRCHLTQAPPLLRPWSPSLLCSAPVSNVQMANVRTSHADLLCACTAQASHLAVTSVNLSSISKLMTASAAQVEVYSCPMEFSLSSTLNLSLLCVGGTPVDLYNICFASVGNAWTWRNQYACWRSSNFGG